MAGINVGEVITGPARLFWKPFLAVAAEPTDPLTDPAVGWLDLGLTQDATNLTIAQSFEQIRAQQILDVLVSVPTERSFTVETSLLQPTLENLKMVNNGGTITTGTGWRKLEPVVDAVGTDIEYGSIIIRGRASTLMSSGTQKMRDLIIRKVATTQDISFSYGKGAAQVLGVTLTAHYVSSGVAPWAIVDAV